MKRAVGYLVGLAVVLLLVLVPAMIYGINFSSSDSYEPTTITTYVADFDVDDQGDMKATETITVDFPTGDRHGIFRFFDREDPTDSHARLQPHDIVVTQDGEDVPVALLTEDHGRYVNARIGDPDELAEAFDGVAVSLSHDLDAHHHDDQDKDDQAGQKLNHVAPLSTVT